MESILSKIGSLAQNFLVDNFCEKGNLQQQSARIGGYYTTGITLIIVKVWRNPG